MITSIEELEFGFKQVLEIDTGNVLEINVNCKLPKEIETKYDITEYDICVWFSEKEETILWVYDYEELTHRTEIEFSDNVREEIIRFAKQYV